MKKMLKISLASAMLLTLASCDNDPGGYSWNSREHIAAYNLVTSADGASQQALTSLCGYFFIFKYDQSGNSVAVNSGSIGLPGGKAVFTTRPMPASEKTLEMEGKNKQVITFSAGNPSDTGAQVSDFNGMLTQAAFLPDPIVVVPGYELVFPVATEHFAVLDYVLDDVWRVRTFWNDVTFCGTTTTNPGADKPYENKNIRYRVVMKTDNGNLGDKADVIFYNAKFAEQAPAIEAIVIKDLKLEFSAAGYKVSGTDVVPSMIEAGALSPTPRYKFDNFSLSVVDDLTQATADYKVAGKFEGSFQGACILK